MQIISTCAFVILCVALSTALPGWGAADTIDIKHQSLVFIQCTEDTGASPQDRVTSSGSGVVISEDGYVLTARHVVPDGFECHGVLGSAAEVPIRKLQIYKYSSHYDAALLRFIPRLNEVFSPLRYRKLDRSLQGSRVVAIGFPSGGSGEPSFSPGGLLTTFHDPRGQVSISNLVSEGMSGGPVIEPVSGNLLGIIRGVELGPMAIPSGYYMVAAQEIAKEFSELEEVQDSADQVDRPGAASLDTEAYETQVVDRWSDWKEGGFDQNSWCSEVRSQFERERGREVEWTVQQATEERKVEFYRRYFYRYYCKAVARWPS